MFSAVTLNTTTKKMGIRGILIFLLLGVTLEAADATYDNEKQLFPDIYDEMSVYDYDTNDKSNSRPSFHYGNGETVSPENWQADISPLGWRQPLDVQQPSLSSSPFLRNRRKHARPLFYINCSHRSQCYCYNKASRHHYCCSCDVGACFPGDSTLVTPQGTTIAMNALRTGDKVLVGSDDKRVVSSEVIGFLDRRPFEMVDYLSISTASGQNLTLSGNHLLLVANSTSTEPAMDFAQNLSVGDSIYLMEESTFGVTRVTGITYELKKGAFVPLTKEGTVVVNGFLASCYASFPHSLSHSFLAPIRRFPSLLQIRWGKKPLHAKGESDPAEDEGYGEPAYITLMKIIGNTFYSSQRASSDVLQVQTSTDDVHKCFGWSFAPILKSALGAKVWEGIHSFSPSLVLF